MVGRGSLFARNYSTGITSETKFLEDFVVEEQEKGSFEEEGSERFYDVHSKKLITFKDTQYIMLKILED